MNFSAFKGRLVFLRALKSVLVGLAVGAAVGGTLNILFRLELIPMRSITVLLIALLSGAIFAAVAYFLLRVSEKKLARKLDDDFALDERVQTALAFRDRTELIYELQRKDAEAALSQVESRKIGIGKLPIYIIAAVLGISALAVSFTLSPEEQTVEPLVEIPFELTAIQEEALLELSEHVLASEMQSPYRENTAKAVLDLLDGLKAADNVRERDEALAKALKTVYEETDNSSYALELAESLYARESETAKLLARAINYYAYVDGREWESFNDAYTLLRAAFIHSDVLSDNPDFVKMATETKALVATSLSNMSVAITRAGMPTDDALAVVISAMIGNQESGLTLVGGSELTYAELQAALDKVFADALTSLFDAVSQNEINTSTGEYAMKRISELFGYACPSFKRPVLRDQSVTGDGSGSDSESGGGQGAIGSGTVFGSDDKVLDPERDEYVEYGTIIRKYYEMMFGKLESDAYTDEEKAAMKKYFELLYGTPLE